MLNAITMGDPAGIGPEVAIKGLVNNETYRNNTFIIGSKSILEHYSKLLDNSYELNIIESPEDFELGKINIMDAVKLSLKELEIGKVSALGGDSAFKYLEKAIELANQGQIASVITGPLNKAALHQAGHLYDGHTEIFAELTGTDKYTMMLWSDIMAVVHVSTHVSLREACDLVKEERVYDCIHLAQDAMLKLGIEKPKIAVAGLNPHAGEGGLFGDEEVKEVTPAIERAKREGIDVSGPQPPDTVFLQASQGHYDIVVAMYHDQGHIPMKLLAFDEGVNVTLGLPIIRTSVDHGTAFDIAGKGIASEESIIAALDLSSRLV